MYNFKKASTLQFRRHQLGRFSPEIRWTCCSSFCVITVSTVHLQTVDFIQYLYSKCSVLLCSWTCSSSFCVITVSTVQLQTVQFVQYLYRKCAVLFCSWTCSSSFCVITVSTVQLQTVRIVQYLYSKCAVLLCSWTWQSHSLSLSQWAAIGSNIHSLCVCLGELGKEKLQNAPFGSFISVRCLENCRTHLHDPDDMPFFISWLHLIMVKI